MNGVRFNKICLASQSPRRAQLLQQIGVDYDIQPAHIDESVVGGEMALEYVERITLMKAKAIWESKDYSREYPVLASDTAVVVDGSILGKPESKESGLAMLAELSGRKHQVITGVGVVYDDEQSYVVSISDVQFRPLSLCEMEEYWSTGEGTDKAGCYAIQGLAATFIESMNGSFSGVMGLPLFETAQLLEQFNVAYWPTTQTN
ncbi:Maf family protein [Pleionea sediminis]|uniref:Maf family protein n=1 Tax=Pleionea sediminis TaxID=2569479 RepID=UPI001186229E|nr:Maf family protein [Pleionea sediminis]